MNTVEKIKTLGEAAKYDICASTSCSPATVKGSRKEDGLGSLTNGGICHSFTPDGRCVSLFKVLMSNKCIGDCKYCLNNCNMGTNRASFEPDELRETFLNLYHKNYVEGLFLSSAVVGDPETTEESMLEIVEKLRTKDGFRGYIHLKIMPGTSRDKIKHAGELANRVSLNLEAPNRLRFQELSSTKDYATDLLRRMRWAQKEMPGESSGQTTQFVVGACEESDYEILDTVSDLYNKIELRRSYFSAFSPVSKTELECIPKTPLLREHRLYQCDFLMRKYGFDFGNIVFDEDGLLDLSLDPKMSFALNCRDLFPIEVNNAEYEDLLKVPGIGPQSAYRISELLKQGYRFRDLSELKNMGVVIKRARSFLSVCGKYQSNLTGYQHKHAISG